MKLNKTIQCSLDEAVSFEYDLFICASGYESRANFLANKSIYSKKKICLGFSEYTDNLVRKKNDLDFEALGFDFLLCSGNTEEDVMRLLKRIGQEYRDSDVVNILVDYSCMTRVWYACILKCVVSEVFCNSCINLFFSYSLSTYVPPPKHLSYNKYVGPIDGFYSVQLPNKPTALIIGLGYVESRAYGLAEYFDVEPFLFIADSSASVQYFNEVMDANKNLLSKFNQENIFYYPILNLKHTETLLYHVTKDLLDGYRVVLAPCGPKPFTLICLLLSLRFSDIDVWRISAGENESPVDKPASGVVSILKLEFAI